ncbi:MAG: cytochrome P450 [Armatimonadetes bacterium]|nr:cytochrome P450 [Anaerolineae bacterium]
MTLRSLTTEPAKPVPLVNGLPIIGVLPQLLRANPFENLKALMLKHGDLIALKFGPLKVYLVSNPDYLQHMLRDEYTNYVKPELLYRVIRRVVGYGLVTSSGDFWLRQRRMIQPHLHRKQLPLLHTQMVTAVTAVLDSWALRIAAGEVFELSDEMAKITMEVISRTMFGNEVLSAADMKRFADSMNVINNYLGRNGYFGFMPDNFPFPGQRQFEQARQTVFELVNQMIQRCREQGDSVSGLMKMMLNTVDEATNEQMTDQQLFDEVMTLFSAGYDTTASVLAWLWTVLDQNPAVAQQLQAEVNAVLGDVTPSFETVTQLEYTRKVFLELLRFRSVVAMLPRKAVAKDMVGGYEIPAGAFVLLFYHGVHHNPTVWQDPERFDPERFTPELVAQRHPFAYLPFSGGPRKCAADEFAMMEGPLIISMILQRFAVQVLPNQDFSSRITVTVRPHAGVKAHITAKA